MGHRQARGVCVCVYRERQTVLPSQLERRFLFQTNIGPNLEDYKSPLSNWVYKDEVRAREDPSNNNKL